jgi:hypothetical protein
MTMAPRQISFLRIVKFRQALIPRSTVRWEYRENNAKFRYTDVFVFGLRIARFQTNGQ